MPAKPGALIVLAHGAGAGMKHPFMESLASELARLSVGSIRFNFPYMDQGKRRPDPPAIAEAAVAAVLQKSHELYPDLPVIAGGKSFGGRMTSQLLARRKLPFVKGVIFYGFPLHPAGRPSLERSRHLASIDIPLLFLQGTRDALAEIDLMEGLCNTLQGATLVKFEGADHSFKVSQNVVTAALAGASVQWIHSLSKNYDS